jgi:hypothetical protein
MEPGASAEYQLSYSGVDLRINFDTAEALGGT